MKRILLSIAVFLGLSSAKAQQVSSGIYDLMLSGLLSHSVPELSVDEVDDLDAFVVLDSRAREEYLVSHLPGAIWVGYDEFDIAKVKDIPKEKPVLVYCSVGYRSEKISEKLEHAGFKMVYNLYGGLFEWVNQGKEVVKPNGETTETVHAYSKSWGIWLKKGEKVYQHD